MLVHPIVDVVDLAFNTQENPLVLCVLLSVPLVESGKPPHQRPTNNCNDNRNPPHDLHPTIPDRFGLDPSRSSLRLLLALALANRWPMEVFFAVTEAKSDAADMALKADGTPTWKNVEREQIAAFGTVNSAHHY